MDVDVIIDGAKTKFIINKAYNSEILLSNGIIDMDWKELDYNTLYTNFTANGMDLKKFNWFYPSG